MNRITVFFDANGLTIAMSAAVVALVCRLIILAIELAQLAQ